MDGFVLWLMGIVAVGAEKVGLVTVPITDSPPVNPRSPVPILFPMTLPAKAVRLIKGHRGAVGQMENVPVFCIMTVKTPPVFLVVPQNDFSVKGEFPSLRIRLQHSVAVGAGEDARCERRGGHLYLATGLLNLRGEGGGHRKLVVFRSGSTP